MNHLPHDPHAIIEISNEGSDGVGNVTWDSWEDERLFETVDVELVTNETSQAEWSFFDPDFKVIDAFAGASPVPMSTVRVFLGYGQDLGEPIFKGLLGQVRREEGNTIFTAFDMGFKMKLIKKAGYANKKDDLDILKSLAARNGLKFEGPDNPLKFEKYESMMQDEKTDWEHAMERARDAGLVLFVRHDTLFAKYPAKVGTPVMTLRNREDFELKPDYEFTHRTPENQDGRPRIVTRRARGKGGRRLQGESDTSARGHETVVLKKDVPGKATKSKLTKRAQAQKELEREHAFEGRVTTAFPIDKHRLDVRSTIGIEGMGMLFSGSYIADAVAYQFAAGKLDLDMELYRDIAQ